MKLTLLGGGGFRVPLIFKALMRDGPAGLVKELRLYDTDQRRIRAIATVLAELSEAAPWAPKVVVAESIQQALAGTDFIFSAIRVGGTAGRALDERIALSHNVIGQETVGAGGISYALRGIPVALELVEQIQRHAPQAWVINFTNPAGIITEVMRRGLKDRVIGICDSPIGLARRIMGTLTNAGLLEQGLPTPGVGYGRVRVEYAGLNHLGWVTGLRVDGQDVLPRLLGRPDLIESFEEGRLFGAPLVQALGAVPNEYLHFYYYSREDLRVDKASAMTRGAFLDTQQSGFYEEAARLDTGLAQLWDRTRLEREETYMASNREAAGSFERDASDLETGGYDEVALAIMRAIGSDVPAELILNVANQGLFPELDDEAVVEVPCHVDARGPKPLANSGIPDHGRGLVVTAKYVERCTMAAALNHSRTSALLALTHHPLIDSAAVAEAILDDLIRNFPQLGYLDAAC